MSRIIYIEQSQKQNLALELHVYNMQVQHLSQHETASSFEFASTPTFLLNGAELRTAASQWSN